MSNGSLSIINFCQGDFQGDLQDTVQGDLEGDFQGDTSNNSENNTSSVSRKAKAKKSTKKICLKIKKSEPLECSICMGVIKHPNKKTLKCRHVFCKTCIQRWFTQNHNTCPNCRKEHRERKKRFNPPERLFTESLICYLHRVMKPQYKYNILIIESGITNHLSGGLPIITFLKGFNRYINSYPMYDIMKLCDENMNGIFVVSSYTHVYFLDEYL